MRKTCVHQHMAQVNAASVRVHVYVGEGALAGSLTVAHHVFVWEGQVRGDDVPAQLVHQGSQAITFVGYTIFECKSGYEWKVFVKLHLVKVE